MYRNKDKHNKIPLEKNLTKEPSKYEKQYKYLDYDTIKDIVDASSTSLAWLRDTNNTYLINVIKTTTSNNSTTMLPHKKHINIYIYIYISLSYISNG